MNKLILGILAVSIFITGCSSSQNKADYFASAKLSHDQSDWQSCIGFLDRAISQGQIQEEVYLLKADCLSRTGEVSDGHSLVHERLSLKPHSIEINLGLINWHRTFGSKLAAIEVARKMLSYDSKNLKVLKAISELSIEVQDWQLAEASLSQIFSLDIYDEDSAYKYGQLCLKFSKTEKAKEVFLRLHTGNKWRIEAAKFLAWIYADSGKMSEANNYLRHLAVEKVDDTFVQKAITRNLLNSPDVDKITVLTNFHNENKEDEWGKYQLYTALNESGYSIKAMDLLAEAAQTETKEKWATINYAHHLNKLGFKESAEKLLVKNLSTSNENDRKQMTAFIEQWNTPQVKENLDPPEDVQRKIANDGIFHVVVEGDSLGSIAHKYLSKASLWERIYRVNKSKILDPEVLVKGTRLVIPAENK